MDPLAHLWQHFGTVEELQIDDEFRSHMQERGFYQEHRVSIIEILEIFDGAPSFTNP